MMDTSRVCTEMQSKSYHRDAETGQRGESQYEEREEGFCLTGWMGEGVKVALNTKSTKKGEGRGARRM